MRKIVAAIFCLAISGRAEWKSLPMPPIDSAARDPVLSVAAHGDALWATTWAGLFRSGDSGRTWQAVRPNGFPPHIRFGSSQSGRLFSAAGCLYATTLPGLFYTCDAGASWKVSASYGILPMAGITRMVGDSALLMAGSPSITDAPYLSTDRGQTWRRPATSFPDGRGLEAIYQDGSRLWLSAGGTVYASDDGGKTWQASAAPVSGWTEIGKHLGALWIWGGFSTLAVSADGGRTWESREVPLPDLVGSFEASSLVSVEGRLFACGNGGNNNFHVGIFMSDDTGKTWTARNQGLPPYAADNGVGDFGLADAGAVYASGRVLLALTSKGVYRSDDLGARWRVSNTGLSATAIRNGGPDRLYPYGDRIYARAIVNGNWAWYASADTGRTWQAWRSGVSNLESLAFSASAVFAFRRSGDTIPPDPVYRSGDGMKSWNPVPGPWSAATFTFPSGLHASGNHVYVISENGGGYWHSADEGATWAADSNLESRQAFRWHASLGEAEFQDDGWTVSRSTDSGRTWKASLRVGGPVLGSAILDQTLLIVASDSNLTTRVFASRDYGRTWSSALPGTGGIRVYDLAVFAGRAYASTDSGLRVSRNGTEWEPNRDAGLSMRGVRSVAAAGNVLLALTNSGLHCSADLGAHWRACGLEKPGEAAWVAAWKNALFAAKPGSGIWASTDTGKTWARSVSAIVLGMAAGPDALVFANGLYNKIQSLSDLTARPINVSDFPGGRLDYMSMAMADGGLYLSKSEGGFANAGPGMSWSALEFPGAWPHDRLAGDGQRLAVTSAEGIFLRGSAQSPWVPAGAGLPRDGITALAMDDGRLFAALSSKGLWMSSAMPVAVRSRTPDAILAGPPAILAGAGGNPVFRLRLERPASIRLSLHAATGRCLASSATAVSAGAQDVAARTRARGAVFYRLEIVPVGGGGGGLTFRGRIP